MPFKNREDYNRYQREQRAKEYPKKRIAILSYKKKKYEEDKKEEKKYRSFLGHQCLIHGACEKFAIPKKIEIIKYRLFRDFTINDLKYQELHANWVAHDYDDDYAPVVSRIEFTKGYILGNLFWGTKKQFGISKRQKIAASDLAAAIIEIERKHAEKAQAPKTKEQEEKSKHTRKGWKESLDKQRAVYNAAMGRK